MRHLRKETRYIGSQSVPQNRRCVLHLFCLILVHDSFQVIFYFIPEQIVYRFLGLILDQLSYSGKDFVGRGVLGQSRRHDRSRDSARAIL